MDKTVFRGNRKFFMVPAGIGGVLLAFALLLFLSGSLFSSGGAYGGGYGERHGLSGTAIMALLIGSCGVAALKVADSTYVDSLPIDRDGVRIGKMFRESDLIPWSNIKRVYSSETAACIELKDGKPLDLNSCLEDFETMAKLLKKEFDQRKV